MFTKEYDSIQDLASVDCMKVIEGSDFDKTFPNYNDQIGRASCRERV